jgi:hypothetical protein
MIRYPTTSSNIKFQCPRSNLTVVIIISGNTTRDQKWNPNPYLPDGIIKNSKTKWLTASPMLTVTSMTIINPPSQHPNPNYNNYNPNPRYTRISNRPWIIRDLVLPKIYYILFIITKSILD